MLFACKKVSDPRVIVRDSRAPNRPMTRVNLRYVCATNDTRVARCAIHNFDVRSFAYSPPLSIARANL